MIALFVNENLSQNDKCTYVYGLELGYFPCLVSSVAMLVAGHFSTFCRKVVTGTCSPI